VREHWDDAIARLGGRPTAGDLERRYTEPHRKYHNAAHITAVLRAALALSPELDPVLVLAICAHDVVYDARPGEDERASAAWARGLLAEAGIAEERIARVEALVLATISHQSDDPLAQVLLDADLAILGATQDVYDTYTRCVREEYASYADPIWRDGRTKVLKSLLDRENLYQTRRGRELWDTRARINIRRELDSLA
jgi:predicted metal-dependent HD superfamily phosphohydrolase